MQLLDAANYVLRTLGERPVSTLDLNHPTLAVVIPELELKRKTLLLRGWWFNHRNVTVLPNMAKEFVVPTGLAHTVEYPYYVLDGKVFDPERETFTISKDKLKVLTTFDVDFEKMPEVAACVVQFEAAISAYCHDIGLESTVQLWQQESSRAYALLEREHLRNMKYNTRQSGAAARILTAMRGI